MTREELEKMIEDTERAIFLIDMKNRPTLDDENRQKRLESELRQLKAMRVDK